MAKDTFYFQHDYNARNDKRTKALLKKHGAAAYGLYWILVEMLHEDAESGVELDEIQYEILSSDTKLTVRKVETIISDCINVYKLFELQDGILKSQRVERNKDKRAEVSSSRSIAGKKGAKKRWQNGKVIAIANSKMANDSKGKEIKGKEIKGNNNNTPPLIVFDDYDKFKENCMKDQNYFIAPLCQQYGHLGLGVDNIAQYLTDFNTHLGVAADKNKSETDYRKHFKNWIPKVLASNKTGQNANWGEVPTRRI